MSCECVIPQKPVTCRRLRLHHRRHHHLIHLMFNHHRVEEAEQLCLLSLNPDLDKWEYCL